MCPWSPGSHLIRNGASTKDNFKMGGGVWMWSFPRATACSQSDTSKAFAKEQRWELRKVISPCLFPLEGPRHKLEKVPGLKVAFARAWACSLSTGGWAWRPCGSGAELRPGGEEEAVFCCQARPRRGQERKCGMCCAPPGGSDSSWHICSQGTENTPRGGDGERGRTSQGS